MNAAIVSLAIWLVALQGIGAQKAPTIESALRQLDAQVPQLSMVSLVRVPCTMECPTAWNAAFALRDSGSDRVVSVSLSEWESDPRAEKRLQEGVISAMTGSLPPRPYRGLVLYEWPNGRLSTRFGHYVIDVSANSPKGGPLMMPLMDRLLDAVGVSAR
jgi:hypothetical protein